MLVTDIIMPGMDGLELMKNIRTNERTKDLPVIMLTAKAQDADVFAGWKYGCDAYLTKPFVPNELLIFVKRVLKAGEETGSGLYGL